MTIANTTKDENTAMQFLQNRRILASNKQCDTCQAPMRLNRNGAAIM